MGANHRSGKVIAEALASTNAGAETQVAFVGHASKVGLLIENLHAANAVTVKILVAGPSQHSGGNNQLSDFHILSTIDPAAGTLTEVTLNLGGESVVAIDLSPFAFSAIKLLVTSTVADTHATVNATATWCS
jgi:hypothetical protein